MSVLALAGSPRRGGNSETLLDWCLEAARAEGAEVAKFVLCELDLHPCRACEACHKNGVCIQKDDMELLYPHLRKADSIVVAAPTYFQGMPALPKIVIDRCQPFWAQKYLHKRPIAEPGAPERRGAYLAVGGTSFKNTFEGGRLVMKTLFHTLDATYAGEALYPGVDAKGDIDGQPGAREAAEELGRILGRDRS